MPHARSPPPAALGQFPQGGGGGNLEGVDRPAADFPAPPSSAIPIDPPAGPAPHGWRRQSGPAPCLGACHAGCPGSVQSTPARTGYSPLQYSSVPLPPATAIGCPPAQPP